MHHKAARSVIPLGCEYKKKAVVVEKKKEFSSPYKMMDILYIFDLQLSGRIWCNGN